MLRDDRLALVWLASTVERQLSRADVDGVSVEEAAKALRQPDGASASMPLRVEGQLVYGLSHILSRKARYLLQDSTSTDRNLVEAFKQFVVNTTASGDSNHGSHGSEGLDLDLTAPFGEGVSAADMSVDAVMRADESAANLSTRMMAEENNEQAHEHNDDADEEQVGQTMANQDNFPSLDFGPDLSADIGSSSPPAEVSTPPPTLWEEDDLPVLDFDEVTMDRDGIEPVKQMRRRKRAAVVDSEISLARPARPPRQILRPEIEVDLNVALPEPEFPQQVSLGEKTERLIDPDWIDEERKRRRLNPEGTLPDANETVDIYDEGPAPDFDEDIEEDVGNEANMEIESDSGIGALSQDSAPGVDYEDNDEEDAERDALGARRAIQRALVPGKCTFDEIPGTFNSRTKAAAFLEVLGMAARGEVAVHQEQAYGNIILQAL